MLCGVSIVICNLQATVSRRWFVWIWFARETDIGRYMQTSIPAGGMGTLQTFRFRFIETFVEPLWSVYYYAMVVVSHDAVKSEKSEN